MSGTVGAGYAKALFDFAVASGADPHTLATLGGFDGGAIADPETRVPLDLFKSLMTQAKALCADAALALKFGAEAEFTDLSIVGLIAHASSNMQEAFDQTNRYARLVIEVEGKEFGPRFVIEEHEGETWLVDQRHNPNAFPELTESTFARFVWNTRRHLGDVPFAKSVMVTHPAPDYHEAYEAILGVPVRFGAPKNAISIHKSWLSIQFPHANRYVFGVFSDRAQALLEALMASKSWRGRVEALMLSKLHTGGVSADWLAGEVGVSRTTLYRHLKSEGHSFDAILDQLRRTMADHYLSGQKLSVQETAYLVGFSDAAAFSRAYKRWTGTSPRRISR
jgi:AraC-like DNA-binding protein